MPFAGESPGLIILVGMILMICSGVAVVSLVSIFNKKNQLNQKEKEIMRASYDQIILQSQLEIQEQTFNTISSELHDNVAQILSLAKIQINIMKERQEIHPEMLDQVKDNISKAMMDLRDIAHGLSSDRIRMRNISDSLCDELERVDKTGFLRTSFTRHGQEPVIAEEKKLLLFRLVQESIQNCIKHAGATDLSVVVSFGGLSMNALVSDNGIGFDLQTMQDGNGSISGNGGIGMITMQRRAWLAGGHIDIDSSPQNGTSVNINIPYE